MKDQGLRFVRDFTRKEWPLRGSVAAVGYSLTGSPTGLAGWLLVHGGLARWKFSADPGQSPARDEVLDDFTRCAGVPGPFLARYASVKTMVQFRGPGLVAITPVRAWHSLERRPRGWHLRCSWWPVVA